jgi:hypothetical protein
MNRENALNFGDVFAVFEPIGKHSKCKRLRLRDRFVATGAVGKDTGEIGHFADPATIVLSLDLNGEFAHFWIVQLRSRFEKRAVLPIQAHRHEPEGHSAAAENDLFRRFETDRRLPID